MKRITKHIYILIIALIYSCSQKDNPKPGAKGEVIIGGTSYKTIVVGSQTWTSQNYDGPGGTANSQAGSIGKFYLLSEIQSIKLPSGWRIPSRADFVSLLKSQGATSISSSGWIMADSVLTTHLMATSGWAIPGDNKSGFNVLPSGEYYVYTQSFDPGNDEAKFWSSTADTIDGSTFQWVLQVIGYDYKPGPQLINGQNAYVDLMPQKGYGYNLRFVKDN